LVEAVRGLGVFGGRLRHSLLPEWKYGMSPRRENARTGSTPTEDTAETAERPPRPWPLSHRFG
jgi:hypothetical protein